MPPKLVSRSDLAKLAGVTKAAITKASRAKLAPAFDGDRVDLSHPAVVEYLTARKRRGVLPATTVIPEAAPAKASKAPAKAPARPRKAAPQKAGAKTGAKKVAATGAAKRRPRRAEPEPERPAARDLDAEIAAELGPEIAAAAREGVDARELASMTIAEVVERFGTKRQYKDWLDALKRIEDTRRLYLDNDETEGKLIPFEFVDTHLLGFVDSILRRLLTDSPVTIARRIHAAAQSGQPVEEAERVVREHLTTQLKPLHAGVVRKLRAAAAKRRGG